MNEALGLTLVVSANYFHLGAEVDEVNKVMNQSSHDVKVMSDHFLLPTSWKSEFHDVDHFVIIKFCHCGLSGCGSGELGQIGIKFLEPGRKLFISHAAGLRTKQCM